MFSSVLRRLLIPTSGCTISVVYAAKKNEESECDQACDPGRTLVRACDLPIYSKEKACVDCPPKHDEGFLIDTIRCARKELWCLFEQARTIREEAREAFESIKGDTEYALEFLREECNILPRVGAIGVGGLTGYILGLRRGPVMRFVYTTVGAGTMAAICYPREAKQYSKEGLVLARKYVIIAYHFLNGDEVDYDKLEQHQEMASDGADVQTYAADVQDDVCPPSPCPETSKPPPEEHEPPSIIESIIIPPPPEPSDKPQVKQKPCPPMKYKTCRCPRHKHKAESCLHHRKMTHSRGDLKGCVHTPPPK